MMRSALNAIDAHSETTAMIGDRMDTDIVAGLEAGLHTILVLTGVTSRDEIERFPYRPSQIVDGVGDLVAQLERRVSEPFRCFGGADPLYADYHDREWGRPVTDERALLERICLEGFQSGLSWLTILRKREGFRAAFAGFDPEALAGFGERDVERLLQDAAIIRHRGKIEATIANGRATAELHANGATLRELLWRYAPDADDRPPAAELRRPAREDARVDGALEGAEEARLPLRRPDDRLRRDAGVRAGQRPPGAVPRARRRRARALHSSLRR